jgi:class 3 adenylate cyclase
MLGWYEACFGSASRILGSLAGLLRNFDHAEKHFIDALTTNEGIGALPWIAHNQRDYAAMLLDRSAPGDEEKALVLIKAMATSRALALREVERGLTNLLKRSNKEDESTALPVANTPDFGSGLHSTVTLMFSDIVDSTKLVEALGDLEAQELMHEHDRVIREALSRHGGREVKTLGDGFMIAFGSARQAVQCAIEIQRSISQLSSPQESEPLRVRVGLHTGEPLNDSGDFFGKAVIVAARVSAQAGPGEILVSETVRDLTENAGDLHFDRGREVRLKGFDRAYRLFRLIVNDE